MRGADDGVANFYEVLKPTRVRAGRAVPFFNKTGWGMQYFHEDPVQQLLDKNVLGHYGH